ncbi:MAG: hypothetical protein WCC87_06630 [Candidatus Korobacteraceae bacterium]
MNPNRHDKSEDYKDILEPIPVISREREIKGVELWVALGLLTFGIVPFIFIVWYLSTRGPVAIKDFMALFVLGLYGTAVIETMGIIILRGMGRLDLSENFTKWLGAATVGEIIGLITLILKLRY